MWHETCDWYVEMVCRNGFLEVTIFAMFALTLMIFGQMAQRFVQEKLMENITLTEEDLGLAFETYISICRDDAKNIESSSNYFMVSVDLNLQYCYKL